MTEMISIRARRGPVVTPAAIRDAVRLREQLARATDRLQAYAAELRREVDLLRRELGEDRDEHR